jgi:hypothetical protein
LYIYWLLSMTSLILEQLSAYSWAIRKLRKDTSVMILPSRNYISLEMYNLLKLIHILRVLVKGRYYLSLSPNPILILIMNIPLIGSYQLRTPLKVLHLLWVPWCQLMISLKMFHLPWVPLMITWILLVFYIHKLLLT